MARRKKPTSQVAEPAPATTWDLTRYPEAAWGAEYPPDTPSSPAAERQRLEQLAARELPRELTARYRALVGKRQTETLTEAERRDLLALTDEVEEFQVKRLGLLAELARIRHVPLRTLAHELGIRFPIHA